MASSATTHLREKSKSRADGPIRDDAFALINKK